MINVADNAVDIAVTIFLNNACNEAASTLLDADRVKNDNAVIGTNAAATPIHKNMFGIITVLKDAVVLS